MTNGGLDGAFIDCGRGQNSRAATAKKALKKPDRFDQLRANYFMANRNAERGGVSEEGFKRLYYDINSGASEEEEQETAMASSGDECVTLDDEDEDDDEEEEEEEERGERREERRREEV